ncbi:MAG TPA: serine O-acetyltransferase, partial [Opitutae bacterium]|nr:serine O-acetyltransferase [Opitutae bacterium]
MQPIDLDAHWSEIRLRANEIVAREPALKTLINETVLDRENFAECLTYRLTRKLVNHATSIEVLHETFMDAFLHHPMILQ